MAVAKLVCGDCGGQVQPGADRCPSCGALLERPAAEAAGKCALCGTVNRPGSVFCSSCGAPLAGGGRDRAAKLRPGRTGGKLPAEKAERGRDPWPIVAGIAVAGLITYFIITELSRDNPAPRPLSSSPPAAAPAPAPAPFPRVDTAPLELAVRENPNDRQALLRLANALHDNGGWVRAIEVYKQYLALDPSNPDARVDMAICYFELAKSDTLHGTALFDTAIKEMEAVVKRTSTHQPAVFNLGVINLTLGRMKESNRWFRRAVELDTTSELGRRAQNILEQHATITQP